MHPPYLSKTLPLKVDHKSCKTLIWVITTWPMITLRHRGIATILSPTMPELFRMSLPKPTSPHRRLYVLTSHYRIYILNHTRYHLQRTLSHLTTKFSWRHWQLAPLQPSSMNYFTRSLARDGSMSYFRNLQLSTCTTLIYT